MATPTTHTGTFAANTSTGNQVIDTGTGVEGKAIIFFGHKVTTAGNAANLELWFGCATSSSQRWCIWGENEDAQATSDSSRRYDDANCILIYNTVAGVPGANGIADFVSFGTGVDAGKFTINWSDAPASAYIIHYQFITGTDSAKAGVFNYPTATGNQDITSVGFAADFVMLAGVMNSDDIAAAPNSTVHSQTIIGFGAGVNQGVVVQKSENARPTWDSYRYQSTSRIWTSIDNQADVDIATYSGGITNGFRLNWSGTVHASGTSEIFYLALKGGQYQVGSFTTQTSTGNFNVNTNFQGKGALFISALATTHTANAGFSFGAATSSSARGAIGGGDVEGTIAADTRSSTALIYTNITAGTPTVNGEIDFVSFNATDMTLNQTDADPSGLPVIFAVLGDTLPSDITGRGRFPLRSAWGLRVRSRKAGGAFLSKMVRFGDTDTADSVMLQDFFQPVAGASYSMTATTASFVITPNAAALRVDNKIAATTSSFALTPTTTGLRRASKLTAVAASVALTANIVGLSVANNIGATTSSFTTTPNVVSLRAARYLSAVAPLRVPTLSTTGVSDTEILLSWTVVPSVTGLAAQGVSDTELLLTWNDAQIPADFNIFTNDVILSKGYTMPADTGSYTLTSGNARIFKTPAALIAEPPLVTPINFAAVNDASETLAFIALNWEQGPGLFISPNVTGLARANQIHITTSSFAITPFDITFPAGVSMAAESGTFAITTNTAGLSAQRKLIPQTASFTITGNDIQFRDTHVMQAESSSIVITTNSATLTYTPISDFTLSAQTGSFSFTPNAANFFRTRVVIAVPATFTFTGYGPTIYAGTRHVLDEPLSVHMSTGQTFVNLTYGLTYINVSTGQTRIDIE